MTQQKKNYFLGYIAIIYSMVLLFALISNICARTSEHWRFIYAFTQQSNIIALIWLTLFGITSFKEESALKRFVNSKIVITAVTVYLSITYFIVMFVLSPVYKGKMNMLASQSELLLHHATPILMWIYFFLVKGSGKMKLLDCLYILIYPFIYVLVNLAVGYNVSYEDGNAAFAYGFINPNSYGNFFIYILVLLALIAVFAAFGAGLMYLKRYLDKKE